MTNFFKKLTFIIAILFGIFGVISINIGIMIMVVNKSVISPQWYNELNYYGLLLIPILYVSALCWALAYVIDEIN